jgi:hypothetical protein
MGTTASVTGCLNSKRLAPVTTRHCQSTNEARDGGNSLCSIVPTLLQDRLNLTRWESRFSSSTTTRLSDTSFKTLWSPKGSSSRRHQTEAKRWTPRATIGRRSFSSTYISRSMAEKRLLDYSTCGSSRRFRLLLSLPTNTPTKQRDRCEQQRFYKSHSTLTNCSAPFGASYRERPTRRQQTARVNSFVQYCLAVIRRDHKAVFRSSRLDTDQPGPNIVYDAIAFSV